MTFKVLTYDAQNILFCSNLRYDEEPMESNLCLSPLFGGPYPFVKLRPDIDKQSVSRLDDSSIKDEQDKNIPMN